ncbi:hypothetical protein EVAR_10529_1 [Eumeta japonica]|uniref:Uncharacterized protein n=1 Tax=Eumeta variegata TaxID=151549 RepID=A0A4C1THJ6_EUMVA|nr:hypothetical protein EVAR_10529_1 [Eumeta japonica]
MLRLFARLVSRIGRMLQDFRRFLSLYIECGLEAKLIPRRSGSKVTITILSMRSNLCLTEKEAMIRLEVLSRCIEHTREPFRSYPLDDCEIVP